MIDALLDATGLAAGYGRKRIVHDIDLCIRPGVWLGLLGANGSGKSTLLRAITGQIKSQAGRVLIGGVDLAKAPEQAKRFLGYAVDADDLPKGLTGQQYLELVASIRGCSANAWPCGNLAQTLSFDRWLRTRIGDCSLGTRMKFSLAAALLNAPPLLILDESLNGLDPVASWRIRGVLADLVASGRHAVVLSTHMMETVAATCTDVAFLDAGRIAHRWDKGQLQAAHAAPGGFEALVMQTLQEGLGGVAGLAASKVP